MAETVLIDIEIPKKGFLNIDADIPEKETIDVTPREQSFIYHDELFHRDMANQHPIGAIAGLQSELDRKATKQALEEETERATRAEQALGERIDNIPQPDLSPYAKKSELAKVATSGKYQDLSGQPTIPSQAGDVHALPDTTKYGANLSFGINPTTYVMTLQLKDQDGNNIGSAQSVDLPLESVVVNGSYDSVNKKIVLTLENGNTIDVPVGDLVAGLQTEITEQNKLSADLVDDTSTTNKLVTPQEKSTWNGKQDEIDDLDDIRAGASAGATALQPSALNGYATQVWVGQQGFLTSTALSGYATQQWVQNQGYLQNTATGTGALTILGTSTSQNQSTNVGIGSVASNGNATAFGYNAKASGGGSLAVGRNSVSSGNTSVALGAAAEAKAQGALMIGGGVNSEAQTLKVALRSSATQATDEATGLFKLMNADGTIPPERHASVSSTAGDYYAKITVDSQGNATSSWGTLDLTGYATETWVSNQGYLTTSDIVSSVDSSSTNSKAVGAKLFYDTCGDIEATLNAIRGI